ncbi:MAG: UPF0175 family protein [Saprospiraceae bacterium]|nr:UPF0175 family protein [Saprospiraceae bacterium]
MGIIQIQLPSRLQVHDFEVKMMVAGSFYEQGRLSASEAAQVAGLSKRAFLEMLGKFGFSVFGYTSEELTTDLQTLEAWKKS